jgi:hypothetical protein
MDDRRRLGMGETDAGGGKGMAALEGFATVLDVCYRALHHLVVPLTI